ncbi:MAG: FkbM family methyltransferase [Alphaproteobacteria bacterium]|nr:FkbM family methyltransferase [Alphaproteobacteria bacterium]
MIRFLKHTLKTFISPKHTYLKRFKIRPRDVVIDLGANVGEVTDYFLRKGAQVYAYEPNLHAFNVLKKRTQNNKNAVLHQVAVSNYNGHAKLWLHEDHAESEVEFSQGSSLQSEKDNVSEEASDVVVMDIADILSAHTSIKLLKIDIEGGEYDIIDCVLENAGKIDNILLETHGQKHKAFAEKESILQEKIKHSPFKYKIYTDWF